MSEEKEQEIKEKSKQMDRLSKRIAKQHASAFEAWLNEHQNATKEEAREKLSKTIEAAMMLHLMMFIASI